jgi:hypothetical protein
MDQRGLARALEDCQVRLAAYERRLATYENLRAAARSMMDAPATNLDHEVNLEAALAALDRLDQEGKP